MNKPHTPHRLKAPEQSQFCEDGAADRTCHAFFLCPRFAWCDEKIWPDRLKELEEVRVRSFYLGDFSATYSLTTSAEG